MTANFIRTKAPNGRGCVELWVLPKSKASAAAYKDPGIPKEAYDDSAFSGCLNTFGSQEFTKTGYSRTGTSWCDGHVGGGSDDDITLIKGRCRYRWVRR